MQYPLKALKLCILPHQIQTFLHKGALPWTTIKGVSPGPHQGPYRHGGRGPHSWVLALRARCFSPPKQFLKDGSPGPRTENGCCHWYICKLQSVMHSRKRFVHVSLRPKKSACGHMGLWPFEATVWAPE